MTRIDFPFNATAVFISAVVGVVFVIILALCLLFRGASFYGSVRKFFKNVLASLSFVYFVMTVIVLGTLCIAIKSRSVSESITMMLFSTVLFIVNICWFYITIICRVYMSFKNSNEYKLSRRELIGSAMFVASQFGSITLTFFYAAGTGLFIIMFVIVICIDTSFNLIFLYMFLKRLYRMIAHLDESFEKLVVTADQIRMSRIDIASEQDNSLATPPQPSQSHSQVQSQSALIMQENIITNRIEQNSINQTEIVNLMAKVSLLTIISEIFINMYFIDFLHLAITFNSNQDSIPIYIYSFIIGLCWNCFTLYATFPFNDKQYVKCCGLCHKGLKNCCVVCVTKRIFRQKR